MSKQCKVAHLLVSGEAGGIETLNLYAAKYSKNDNIYFFILRKGAIYHEMVSQGFRCEFIGTSKSKYLKDCLKFTGIIRRERISTLICHFNNPFVAMCALCVRLFNRETRIIGYMHCSPDDCNRKEFICAKIIFRQAKKIICVSDSVLMGVKTSFEFGDKLVRIYNGVDLSKFRHDERRFIKTKSLKLIYIGRLEKVKGVQTILELLNKIKEIPYHFKIVGDGSYRSELEKLSADLNLTDKVEFLGSRRDIPELLFGSDIFIHLPEYQEGFGITVIEAMAAGKICIVNDHGALPEIITDGVDGYIIQKGKRSFNETISEIYESVIDNKKLENISKIQRMAVKRAQEFSVEKYADAIDSLLLTIV